MPSTYTPSLKIEKIGIGDQNNTWGTTTNNNFQYALEEAITGRTNVIIPNPPPTPIAVTLTLTDTNASQTARFFILNVTSAGTLSSTQTIRVPSNINKPYIIENNTTGSQAITITTATGTGVTIPANKKALVYAYYDGVINEVNLAVSYLSLPTIDTPTISGGTLTTSNLNRTLTAGGKVVVSGLGTLTTGTTTIDLSTAQVFTATITAANTITFAFSNAPSANQSQIIIMRLTNAGSGTIVWPAGTKFANGGTAPTLTTAGVDMLGIYYDVTTTTYMVFVIGTDVQ